MSEFSKFIKNIGWGTFLFSLIEGELKSIYMIDLARKIENKKGRKTKIINVTKMSMGQILKILKAEKVFDTNMQEKLDAFLDVRNPLIHKASRKVAYAINREKESVKGNKVIEPLIPEISKLLNDLVKFDNDLYNEAIREENKLIKFIDWCNKQNGKLNNYFKK